MMFMITPALSTQIFSNALFDSSSSSAPLISVSIFSSSIPFIFTYPPSGSAPMTKTVLIFFGLYL